MRAIKVRLDWYEVLPLNFPLSMRVEREGGFLTVVRAGLRHSRGRRWPGLCLRRWGCRGCRRHREGRTCQGPPGHGTWLTLAASLPILDRAFTVPHKHRRHLCPSKHCSVFFWVNSINAVQSGKWKKTQMRRCWHLKLENKAAPVLAAANIQIKVHGTEISLSLKLSPSLNLNSKGPSTLKVYDWA